MKPEKPSAPSFLKILFQIVGQKLKLIITWMLNTMVLYLQELLYKISQLFMIPVLLIYGFPLHNANYHQDVYSTVDIQQVHLPLINQTEQLSQSNMDLEQLKVFGLTIMLILLESMLQMQNLVRLLKNKELHLLLLNLMEFQVQLGHKSLNVSAQPYSRLFGLRD